MAKKGHSTKNIRTPIFRLSFPHLFKPHAVQGSTNEKYSINMIFTMEQWNSGELKEMVAMANEALAMHWPDEASRPKLNGLTHPVFKKGDDKPQYDGYPGNLYVRASSLNKPGVVDRNLNDIEDPNIIYPGCYCMAMVNAFTYDNVSKGVSIGLGSIQKVKEGVPFTMMSDPREDFDVIAEEGDFDLPSTGAGADDLLGGDTTPLGVNEADDIPF